MASSVGSRDERDIFNVPVIINGLWSQPRRHKDRPGEGDPPRKKSDSAGADQTLLLAEELKAKDKCIDMLTAKLARATTAVDNANRLRKTQDAQMEAMVQDVSRAARSSAALETQLRACEDQVRDLQNHCSSQEVDMATLRDDLARSRREPPALIARLEEENRRRAAVERALSAERAVVRSWMSRAGVDASAVEPSAVVLAQRIDVLEAELAERDSEAQAAAEQLRDLEEALVTEREWRESAQQAAAQASDACTAARARGRTLALQLDRARADAGAAEARAREALAAEAAREEEVKAKREAAKHRRHRVVTEKMAVSKAMDDRVEVLEKQLAKVREQTEAEVAAARAEGNARAQKLKQRALALAKRCLELEQAQVLGSGGAIESQASVSLSVKPLDVDPSVNNKGAPAWMNFNFEIK